MIILNFQNQIKPVVKIKAHDFTDYHHQVISNMKFSKGSLVIPDPNWTSIYLGAGEEKAVFCICDHENKVFALEAIDEKHYLNGRFVGGQYFFDKRIEGFRNVKLKPGAVIGLTFTGLIRVREFVHGYEWGRFQYDPQRKRWIDSILTSWLHSFLASKFEEYKKRYKDVHERNVMLEIRELNQPGIPAIAKDWNGKLRFIKVWLQPIDVR
ncbi:MAG: hypothetical protein N2645_19290 [Clostridia bacterium]|nr:hypothetical protein [Clostridia bacterium]